jgi:hypothetical protein
VVVNNRLIPNHQFFRQRHSTIEQTHRIVQRINEALENKQYWSEAFLDISQEFDKVWHTGLLYKLRLSLPLNYFFILKSYLHCRHFLIKVETEYTELSLVNAGVFQGIRVSQSQSYITTDDQSVSMSSCRAQSGTFDQRPFFFESHCPVIWGRPLWREVGSCVRHSSVIYNLYKIYNIQGLSQYRLCTADYALVTSRLLHYGSLDTWTVVHMTAAKFKPHLKAVS